MVRLIVKFHGRKMRLILSPWLLELVQGLAGGGELLGNGGRIRSGLLLQFQNQRQARVRRGLQELDCGGAIDGAVAGPEGLVFFTLIVGEGDGGDGSAEGGAAPFGALLFWQFVAARVARFPLVTEGRWN